MHTTLATRRLCAGVYLDGDFCQRVVLDAYADRSRFVAPSYGFELAQLVYHGRRAWRVNLLQHILVLGVTAVGLWMSPLAVVFAGGLAMMWYAASSGSRLVADFVKLLRNREPLHLTSIPERARILIAQLIITGLVLLASTVVALGYDAIAALWRPHRETLTIVNTARMAAGLLLAVVAVVLVVAIIRQALIRAMVTGGAIPRKRLNRRMQDIRDQEQSSVTYYADFRPFIGSGEELTTWNITLQLLPAETEESGGSPLEELLVELPPFSQFGDESDHIPFEIDDLFNAINEALTRLALTSDGETALPDLEIRERVFVVGALARQASTVHGKPVDPGTRSRMEPSGPARRYLSCKVVAWDGEIVTTVFMHASLQGKLLYLEFSVWALLPTRPDFHAPQANPGSEVRISVPYVARQIVNLPDHLRRLPSDLLSIGTFVRNSSRQTWRTSKDPGARFSAREDGAIKNYVARVAAQTPEDIVSLRYRDILLIEEATPERERAALKERREAERLTRQAAKAVNYFQTRDILHHWKIIERRVLLALLEFLDDRGLSTAEFKQRAEQIITKNISVFNAPVNAQGASFGSGNVTNNNAAATRSGG